MYVAVMSPGARLGPAEHHRDGVEPSQSHAAGGVRPGGDGRVGQGQLSVRQAHDALPLGAVDVEVGGALDEGHVTADGGRVCLGQADHLADQPAVPRALRVRHVHGEVQRPQRGRPASPQTGRQTRRRDRAAVTRTERADPTRGCRAEVRGYPVFRAES